MTKPDPFHAKAILETSRGSFTYHRLAALEEAGLGQISRLPYSIRVLVESALRNLDGFTVSEQDVRTLAGWSPETAGSVEIPFLPGRVVLQDFTGVPCAVDLAAMRAAMQRLGGDPTRINPLVPCDLVIDHSVQVDFSGSDQALLRNVEREFERNRERYEFLKWSQKSFRNFRVVPPATGIVHQVNLEYLATVALSQQSGSEQLVYPDSLVGTDSHTTMINGLGVVGWGVGGIEAEAVMLGQPIYMLLPEVVGVELTGTLPEGSTATDLVLTVTELLRGKGVVGKFVEFHGEGVRNMSLADRATLANMAPEYGATMGFFPVDEETLGYLSRTGRSDQQVELVRAYYRAQGMLADPGSPTPVFTDHAHLDLGVVVPSLSGPKRPQDRVPMSRMKEEFQAALRRPLNERGFALSEQDLHASPAGNGSLTHGSVVIAAITSCTNTSNPSVMVAAGLLARNAVAKGLRVRPQVKTSLAPGSKVVTDYLHKSGLDKALDQLGFQTVGYGCTTCIGNSGPLPEPVSQAIHHDDLVAASVLSGNRNFEGRISQDVKANYLASPPLVVAYALAGRVDIDLHKEPLGRGSDGDDVYLKDIWPSSTEIQEVIAASMSPESYRQQYADVDQGPKAWQKTKAKGTDLYAFDPKSTYIQEPPFFPDMKIEPDPIQPIRDARVLVMVGDSATTDHISPAGAIDRESPAGKFLIDSGVQPRDFNSYGSRRGNDRVMTRGTFANIRLRNLLAPGTEGGVTRHLPSGNETSVYEAALEYQKSQTPLMVLAGKEYGTGSSRDWAAKGTMLLGARMVLAESYERIHRSNLVGMGVLPLQFDDGQSRATLGLTGEEIFSLEVGDDLQPRAMLQMHVRDADGGNPRTFPVRCRIDTPVEVDYYRNGGILPAVLRKLLRS